MDPVSVFNALYDTKCIKFGRFHMKSGLVAPYYINLRRLPLYPDLMDAVVSQVVDRFLTNHSLASALAQIKRKQASMEHNSPIVSSVLADSIADELGKTATDKISQFVDEPIVGDKSAANDSDSQLEEDELETSSCEGSEWENIADNANSDTIICGVPYGAVPLASAVAYKARLPFLFERREPKLYGDHQPLMEDFNDETRSGFCHRQTGSQQSLKQQRIILIEDVICSGESILAAVKALERQNIKVEFVICIVDREENGIDLLLEQNGVHVLSLYKMSAILRVLETTGRISSEQFISTRKWMAQNQFVTIGVDPTIRINVAAPIPTLTARNATPNQLVIPTKKAILEVASN